MDDIEEFIKNQWSFFKKNDTLNYSLLQNKPELEEILSLLIDFLKNEFKIKDNSNELNLKIIKFYSEMIKTYEVKETKITETLVEKERGFPTFERLYKGEIDTMKWFTREKFNHSVLYK